MSLCGHLFLEEEVTREREKDQERPMLADARDIKSSQTEGERHTKLQKERDIQSSQIRRRKETYKARKHTKRERHTQLAKTHKERDIQSSQRHRPPRIRVYLLLCVWSVCCARTHLRLHVLVSVFCSQRHSRRDTHTAFRDTDLHVHMLVCVFCSQRHRPTLRVHVRILLWHVTHLNESCHTYKCGIAHVCMRTRALDRCVVVLRSVL